MVVGDLFISQIVNNHGNTLTRLNAVNVSLTEESLELICTSLDSLEQLAMVVPMKDMVHASFFEQVYLLSESIRIFFRIY